MSVYIKAMTPSIERDITATPLFVESLIVLTVTQFHSHLESLVERLMSGPPLSYVESAKTSKRDCYLTFLSAL